MIKLYVLYLVFGLYMFFESELIRAVSFWTVSSITYVALISSGILSVIASTLALYRLRSASIVGLICLIGVSPFGIHWLWYNCTDGGPITEGTNHKIMLLATVWYIITMFYTCLIVVKGNATKTKPVKKSLKMSFTAISGVFLILMILSLYY